MRILPLLVSCLLMLGAAQAAELRGQDDPRFRTALALWLADDEETALPELAALAAGGNRAAQVLLARIDLTPSLQGPMVAGLPRSERNALLRAPGGISGRSWIYAAAADTPQARLWLAAAVPDATVDTALDLARLGERRAARATLLALLRREYRGFAAAADDPDYPPEARFLIWREWAEDPAGRARVEAEIAALHPGDPQRAHFDFRPIDPGALADWLAEAPLAAPLRDVCAAICPDTARSCARAAYQLLSPAPGSDMVVDSHSVLLAIVGSPSESLVAPEAWNASPRGRAALLRLPLTRSDDAESVLARARSSDACLGAAASAEAARFRE